MKNTKNKGNMFKRLFYWMILFGVFTPGMATAGFLSQFSLSLNPGTLLALNGKYSDSESLKEMVLPGAGVGLILRYKINKAFFIEAGYSYNWLFIKRDKRPSDYVTAKPALILPMYTLNGTFFLTSESPVEPYFTLGGGLCPWWFGSELIGGEFWPAPGNAEETFSKSSLCLNGGLGIEAVLWSRLSLCGEVRYWYIFAKDEEKLGTGDFTNQGFLGIRVGLTFYFGKK